MYFAGCASSQVHINTSTFNVQVTEACWRHLQSSLWTQRSKFAERQGRISLRCQKHKWPKITNYKLIQTYDISLLYLKNYITEVKISGLYGSRFLDSHQLYRLLYIVTTSFWRNASAHHVHPPSRFHQASLLQCLKQFQGFLPAPALAAWG